MEFLELSLEYFNYLRDYSDGIIILIALYLFSQAKEGNRKISYTVLLYLVVSDIAYHYFFTQFREGNHWAIYQIYNVINLVILIRLDYLKSHNAIKTVISANILLNIAVSFYFISSFEIIWLYSNYYYIATSIAILALFYMSKLNDNGNMAHNNNNRNAFNRFLCRCNSFFFSGN